MYREPPFDPDTTATTPPGGADPLPWEAPPATAPCPATIGDAISPGLVPAGRTPLGVYVFSDRERAVQTARSLPKTDCTTKVITRAVRAMGTIAIVHVLVIDGPKIKTPKETP